MDLNVLGQKDNILLSRKEVTAELSFFGAKTPSKEEVKKKLSEKLKVSENLIVVKSIDGKFGSPTAKVLAYSYLSEGDLKRIEPKEKKKKADAPGEAPKEEAKKGK